VQQSAACEACDNRRTLAGRTRDGSAPRKAKVRSSARSAVSSAPTGTRRPSSRRTSGIARSSAPASAASTSSASRARSAGVRRAAAAASAGVMPGGCSGGNEEGGAVTGGATSGGVARKARVAGVAHASSALHICAAQRMRVSAQQHCRMAQS
jgi:hypothetical protein